MALLLVGSRQLYAGSQAADSAPEPKLIARIPVAPLGYHPPGALYLLSRMSFSSLNFVDSEHLLFTFHKPGLLKREPDCSPSDDDQMIRALVLALPGGRILATADWRMHDRDRYLWPLAEGRFLVRQRNTYFLTGVSLTPQPLKLQPWISSPTEIEATEVSPDGRLLVVENQFERHTPEEHKKLTRQAALLGEPPPGEDTGITLMDADTRVTRAQVRVELPVKLPVTSSGYLSVEEVKSNDYEIRFVPFQGPQVTLGRVMSSCTPRETFLNSRAVTIESCGPDTPDIFLDTWTIDGKKLWRGRRDGHAVWPTFAMALNGSRFAVGLLQASHYVDLADSLNDEDVKEQMVQVFDTNSGKLLLTTNASPILSAGQNFALSPDGSRFAVLRERAIEVYDLPSATAGPLQKR